MKKTLILIFLLWAVVCGMWAVSFAAETDTAALPVEVNGDRVEYFESEKKMIGQGNVLVTYKDIKMTCNKVTAYLESKNAIAEGNVVVTRGDDVIKGERVEYNFETETGNILDGVVQAGAWYGGGKELNRTSKDEVDITDGYLTTCDRSKPHYRIHSKKVKIYMGKRIVAKNVAFEVAGVPILYLPIYSQPIRDTYPKISFIPGRDKAWGTYLLSSYRYHLTDDIEGNIRLDYRQNKGFGEGVDYHVKTKKFGTGYLLTYYMNERDKIQHTEKERWRVEYRHKWEITPHTVGALEYHRFSDQDVTRNYFYREEFEREPAPETYLSFTDAQSAFTTSLLVKKRVNRFFTEVERLPEAELSIKNQRLTEALPLFYKGDYDVVGLNKKTAYIDDDHSTVRFDTFNQLSLPFRVVDSLSVDPYVGVRETFYSREAETDQERFRGANF